MNQRQDIFTNRNNAKINQFISFLDTLAKSPEQLKTVDTILLKRIHTLVGQVFIENHSILPVYASDSPLERHTHPTLLNDLLLQIPTGNHLQLVDYGDATGKEIP